MIGEKNPTTTVTGVELIITIDHTKKIDIPKELNSNPPEIGTTIKAIVGLGTTVTQTVKNEYHCLHSHMNKNTKAKEKVPSSEILIAMTDKKGSKKYTTYLGLLDSGASGLLINKELVEYADFDTQLQKKPTKWDTASGIFQTDGTVLIGQNCSPQFTRKKHITMPFYMFQKCPKDKYDFILGCNLLKDLGFDIHYSTSQFVKDNISVDMVPSGYWTKSKITNVAKTWNPNHKQEELWLAKILPAEYKPADILEVIQKQMHLIPEE